jgi:hypothetical protein
MMRVDGFARTNFALSSFGLTIFHSRLRLVTQAIRISDILTVGSKLQFFVEVDKGQLDGKWLPQFSDVPTSLSPFGLALC